MILVVLKFQPFNILFYYFFNIGFILVLGVFAGFNFVEQW